MGKKKNQSKVPAETVMMSDKEMQAHHKAERYQMMGNGKMKKMNMEKTNIKKK